MARRILTRMALTLAVWAGLLIAAHAHKPLIAVEDNMDGTIYIEAAFSDGSSAAGPKIVFKEEATGKTLAEERIGEDGTLELKKPSVPYTVTLDAGEGHTVTVDGPPPSEAPPAGPEQEPAEPKALEAAAPAAPEPAQQATPKPAPALQQGQVRPESVPAATPVGGYAAPSVAPPGAVMAFNMMITTQIVVASALIILLVVVVYYIGYRIGKNAGDAGRRRGV